ncbi:hypothetical protein CLU79DRAFT_524300 [Phycomyces nitens]|nr:hypothetical protein CLU79DRAFT_524300 [Phycomyces nitens]
MQPENTALPPPQEIPTQPAENEAISSPTPNSPKESISKDKVDSAESAVNISTNEALGAINSPNAIEAIKGRIIATHLLLARLRANEEKLTREVEINKELHKELSDLRPEIESLRNALKLAEATEAQHRGQQALIAQLEAKVEDLVEQLAKRYIMSPIGLSY